MKKIINNKVYDTDTAKELGLDNGGDGFNHWCETLYQKRTGEYFLYGCGGPMTKYAVSCGNNSWSGGKKIIPLAYENARVWAEEHLDADKYIDLFGDPDEEDEGKEVLHVVLPKSILLKIRSRAAENGMTITAYLTKTLRKME